MDSQQSIEDQRRSLAKKRWESMTPKKQEQYNGLEHFISTMMQEPKRHELSQALQAPPSVSKISDK
ncbi:hypothetical protein FJZ28_02605 [Candidatus Peregrinibacteria bacterium]|nr:hypothetical protein [Candidatus Peregrinibacteria bacterium]